MNGIGEQSREQAQVGTPAGEGGGVCPPKYADPEPCPSAPPPADDDKVDEALRKPSIAVAEAELIKPKIAEDLAFAQGHATVRPEIVAAYTKALSDGLKSDHKAAQEAFKTIAADLVRKDEKGKSPLEKWINTWLGDPKTGIAAQFERERQVEKRLIARSGPRECALRRAEEASARWKQAHENWKAPGAKIKAIVDSYKDQLPKLACEIHRGDGFAIYLFWFELAPKHLGLCGEAIDDNNAPGVTLLREALAAYPARRTRLSSAFELNQGGLFRIDPDKLDKHREGILDKWGSALKAQAEAEVEFKLRPDDAASLKARLTKLAADEAGAIKKLFEAKP